MRKFLVLFVLVSQFFVAVAIAESSSDLRKYLLPASITRLDWLLLRAEVSSFSKDIRWDDHRVIDSVSLYAINERALVGMVFLVNKDPYIAVSDDTARKVFSDAVLQASKMLGFTIPEVEGGTNIYANFMVVGGDMVAEWINGDLAQKK